MDFGEDAASVGGKLWWSVFDARIRDRVVEVEAEEDAGGAGMSTPRWNSVTEIPNVVDIRIRQ